MPPLHSLATSNSINFTSPGHFNRDKSSVGVHVIPYISGNPGFPGRWCRNLLPAPCIRKRKIKRVHDFNIPADEAPLPHFFFRVTGRSDARGNGGRRDSQQNPPYRRISGTLVRQWPRPRKQHLLILLDACICFRPSWDPHRLS